MTGAAPEPSQDSNKGLSAQSLVTRVGAGPTGKGSVMTVVGRVGAKEVNLALDTQASITMVSSNIGNLGTPVNDESCRIHFGVGSGRSSGIVALDVTVGSTTVHLMAHVVDKLVVDIVIGMQDLISYDFSYDAKRSGIVQFLGQEMERGSDGLFRIACDLPVIEECEEEAVFVPRQDLVDDWDSEPQVLVATVDREDYGVEEIEQLTRMDFPPEQLSLEEKTKTWSEVESRIVEARNREGAWGEVFWEFRTIFENTLSEPGAADVEQQINTGDAKPCYEPPRRHNPMRRAVLLQQQKDWSKRGIIEESRSAWVSNAHCVADDTKPGGFRVVGDYRKLNRSTVPDRYPPDQVEYVYDKLRSADMISKFDGTEGYLAVPIAKGDRHKTAIRLPVSMDTDGLFQLTVSLFGLKNSGAAYDRWMNSVIRDLPDVCSYRDDLFVTTTRVLGETDGQLELRHIGSVRKLFEKLQLSQVRLKPKKIAVALVPSKPFVALGYEFYDHRLRANPASFEAIDRFEYPTSVSELRRFTGMIEWFRRFIPRLAQIGKALTDAAKMPDEIKQFNDNARKSGGRLRSDWSIRLSEEARKAMDDMKLALKNMLQLATFAYSDEWETYLSVDASGLGIGAILSQRHVKQDRWEIVACWSRKMTPHEKGYLIPTEMECLAIMAALVHWEYWLECTPSIKIHSDHQALQWLLDQDRDASPARVRRWQLLLQRFDYDVSYVSGRKMEGPDALSRSFSGVQNCDEESTLTVLVSRLGEEVNSGEELFDITTEQASCPEVVAIRHWLIHGALPKVWTGEGGRRSTLQYHLTRKVGGFLERNGVLWIIRKGDKLQENRRLVVPVSIRRTLVYAQHDLPTGGHRGWEKTYQALKLRYWWPGMRGDVQGYVESCPVCQRVKGKWPIPGDLSPLAVTKPFEYVHLDLIGPLPPTIQGNRYILSVVDRATKRVILLALKDKTAESVAWAFVTKVVCWHGSAPATIQTDQGAEFVNGVVAQMTEILGIRHVKGAAYHPQTNGMVERMNLPVEQILASFESMEQSTWDTFLDFAMYAINNTKAASTQETPNFLTFGRRGLEPMDLLMGVDVDPIQTKEKWLMRLQEARKLAASHQELAATSMKEHFDKNKKPHDFKVGDVVWVREVRVPKGKSGKLRPKASATKYVVTDLKGGSSKHAVVQGEQNSKDVRQVHVDRLKHVVVEQGSLFGEASKGEVIIEDEPDSFEVELILDERNSKKGKEYLVRWLGYGPQDDSWILERNLKADEALVEYQRISKMKKVSKPVTRSYAEVAKSSRNQNK